MAEAKIQKRNTYTIYDDEGLGTVQIADEVVAIIAGLAATEVDGVASMAGNITNELVSKLGMKNLSKGVKVDVLDGVVCVDLAPEILFCNLVKLGKQCLFLILHICFLFCPVLFLFL